MLRPEVDANFFSSWSPAMAYILGFIFADGCLVEHKNGYHGLDITSKDIKHLVLIKKQLRAEHRIGRKEKGYRLQIRNRNIYSDLIRLGLTPRKSKRVRFPKIPKRYFVHFIRGLFDGDGSVFIWKEPRWRHTWQRTGFSSRSIKFLKKLRWVLQENAGLTKGYLQFNRKSFDLKYVIKDSLALYRFMYHADNNLSLKRKERIFDLYFRLRRDSS